MATGPDTRPPRPPPVRGMLATVRPPGSGRPRRRGDELGNVGRVRCGATSGRGGAASGGRGRKGGDRHPTCRTNRNRPRRVHRFSSSSVLPSSVRRSGEGLGGSRPRPRGRPSDCPRMRATRANRARPAWPIVLPSAADEILTGTVEISHLGLWGPPYRLTGGGIEGSGRPGVARVRPPGDPRTCDSDVRRGGAVSQKHFFQVMPAGHTRDTIIRVRSRRGAGSR